MGEHPIYPLYMDYTVLFNGSFSGLAYGLEDEDPCAYLERN